MTCKKFILIQTTIGAVLDTETIKLFFPDYIFENVILNDNTSRKDISHLFKKWDRECYKKCLLSVSSSLLKQVFYDVAIKYPHWTFIATQSTSNIRQEAPVNMYFSLQSNDSYLVQVFGTNYTPSANRWLITRPGEDPFYDEVATVANFFNVNVITPNQIQEFSAQISLSDAVFICLFTASDQLFSVSSLPRDFKGSILYIDIPPASLEIFNAAPPATANQATFSPGSGTVNSEFSKWNLQNRNSFSAFTTTDIMSIYYYLSFIKQWKIFIRRDIVLKTNDNYRMLINVMKSREN